MGRLWPVYPVSMCNISSLATTTPAAIGIRQDLAEGIFFKATRMQARITCHIITRSIFIDYVIKICYPEKQCEP